MRYDLRHDLPPTSAEQRLILLSFGVILSTAMLPVDVRVGRRSHTHNFVALTCNEQSIDVRTVYCRESSYTAQLEIEDLGWHTEGATQFGKKPVRHRASGVSCAAL